MRMFDPASSAGKSGLKCTFDSYMFPIANTLLPLWAFAPKASIPTTAAASADSCLIRTHIVLPF